MPVMPRTSGKAKKIAYKILGIPANMRNKPKKDNKVEQRLVSYETYRVK